MNQQQFHITCFYLFTPIEDLDLFQQKLETKAEELGVRGLIILAAEGLNGTVSCPDSSSLENFEKFLTNLFSNNEINFKHSYVNKKHPFRLFKVKQRQEIVTLKTPHLVPDGDCQHLNPDQWNKILREEEDFLLIDTRNWYETKLGKFKGAVDPKIERFTDFPEYLKNNEVPKDKKILIYCTGGIRCEKGLLEMQEMGYENVFQLKGGILKYLEEHPNEEYEGECFVFDHRVAVDQNLLPTEKAKLCPHTGQPATLEITCARCDRPALIAEEVANEPVLKDTCSKNCAYHWRTKPGQKGPPQLPSNQHANSFS